MNAVSDAGVADLANMFEFNRTRVPNRQADLVRSRELYPEIQDVDRWIAKHGARRAASLDAWAGQPPDRCAPAPSSSACT